MEFTRQNIFDFTSKVPKKNIDNLICNNFLVFEDIIERIEEKGESKTRNVSSIKGIDLRIFIDFHASKIFYEYKKIRSLVTMVEKSLS